MSRNAYGIPLPGEHARAAEEPINHYKRKENDNSLAPPAESETRPLTAPNSQSASSGSDRGSWHLHHHHHHHHAHNLFHKWRKSRDDAVVSEPQPEHSVFSPKVAHLTIEDGEFGDLYPDEREDYDGRDNFYQSQPKEAEDIARPRPGSPAYINSNPYPALQPGMNYDGLVDEKSQRAQLSGSSHHHHDSSHPSHHYHPDHLQSPHTKEERENALILSYLRAVPARSAPDPKTYRPHLETTCGPLLRYSGLRRSGTSPTGRGELTAKEERETWRGTVMIVTRDERSDYRKVPSLRLFHADSSTEGTNGSVSGTLPKSRKSSRDGEKLGKYEEIEAIRLHAERGVTFWRFGLEVELSDKQSQVVYRINHGPKKSFWVPARKSAMNIMFHSCNGFSLSVNPADFEGPDPLWRDVLNAHQTKPFHVMLGGGDQIYNDAVTKQTTHFQAWLALKTPFHKSAHEFTPEMDEELESFYLERYSMWFSQGLFGEANSQIPMINIWDDHDIIDGFGSYPTHFNRCPVFSGLGAVAFKYYLLFQHQSTSKEMEEHEPSWLLGSAPGPFIAELSRSTFMFLGRSIAFLGLDCRTERMRDVVVSAQTYNKVFARLHKEVVVGETKHLIVLLGVPVAYPRLVWLENLLTSRIMDPIKALSRMGILGGFINNFDGGVELLDDLDDHWAAKNHKAERNWFVKKLQEFAAQHSIRVTVLGGDVHLAGLGQFYSNPKLNIPKERDHRYIPNVISSAIVNTPPPETMANILNRRNKVHHLDSKTDEDMYPLFTVDVDGKNRSNKRLMPRRNYAIISAHTATDDPFPDDPKPSRESTFTRMRRGSSKPAKRPSIAHATTFAQETSFDGAGGSHEPDASLRQDDLEVIFRVEVNQHDPSGTTKPYKYRIPALACDPSAANGP